MKVIELSKKYCRDYYNGNFDEMVKAQDGVIYDDERIQKAFNYGKGTLKDFNRWMRDNKIFCKYYDLENQKYI